MELGTALIIILFGFNVASCCACWLCTCSDFKSYSFGGHYINKALNLKNKSILFKKKKFILCFILPIFSFQYQIGLLQSESKKRILIFDLQKALPPLKTKLVEGRFQQPEVCAYS